jgi:hypothetical protein
VLLREKERSEEEDRQWKVLFLHHQEGWMAGQSR